MKRPRPPTACNRSPELLPQTDGRRTRGRWGTPAAANTGGPTHPGDRGVPLRSGRGTVFAAIVRLEGGGRGPPANRHQPPTAADRQPSFHDASMALCLAHVLTMKQRASP